VAPHHSRRLARAQSPGAATRSRSRGDGQRRWPWAGGRLYDAFGSYFWLFIGSFGIGLGAVGIAFTCRPPCQLPAALPSPSVAH
jgi:hypothetical protein